MSAFELEWIKERICREEYLYSLHNNQERKNDNLSLLEVEEAILNGRILEEYPDTGRGV